MKIRGATAAAAAEARAEERQREEEEGERLVRPWERDEHETTNKR